MNDDLDQDGLADRVGLPARLQSKSAIPRISDARNGRYTHYMDKNNPTASDTDNRCWVRSSYLCVASAQSRCEIPLQRPMVVKRKADPIMWKTLA